VREAQNGQRNDELVEQGAPGGCEEPCPESRQVKGAWQRGAQRLFAFQRLRASFVSPLEPFVPNQRGRDGALRGNDDGDRPHGRAIRMTKRDSNRGHEWGKNVTDCTVERPPDHGSVRVFRSGDDEQRLSCAAGHSARCARKGEPRRKPPRTRCPRREKERRRKSGLPQDNKTRSAPDIREKSRPRLEDRGRRERKRVNERDVGLMREAEIKFHGWRA
jgi:hypothetical protein